MTDEERKELEALVALWKEAGKQRKEYNTRRAYDRCAADLGYFLSKTVEACPGCGCRPGDGITEKCNHPAGCGYWKEEHRKMTNPDVYPITAAFEKEVRELKLKEIGRAIAQRMICHIGEYEHGVAEPRVLLDDRVQKSLEALFPDAREEKTDVTRDDLALHTMSAMFLDYLRTYWTVDKSPTITVWMPDDDTAMNMDAREDVEKAVKACGGYYRADEGWNYIAVSAEPFTPEEASTAMKEQAGTDPIKPEEWTESSEDDT